MSQKALRKMSMFLCLIPGMAMAVILPSPDSPAPMEPHKIQLPSPKKTHIPPKTLHLHQAILLALRNNPSVKSSKIQRVVDRYQLMLARHAFRPQYQLHWKQSINQYEKPTYHLSPRVSVKTPLGTEFSVDYDHDFTGHSGSQGTFSLKQPLIRGFGAVNTIPYNDALANEQIAKLTYQENVSAVIDAVILSYRTLVEDYNNITIQQDALATSRASLKRYALRVKVGKMAPSDILQQKASYAATKLAYVRQKNALQQDYQRFLSAIGLVPQAQLKIPHQITMKPLHLPSQQQAIDRALRGNVDYLQAQIQLQNSRRAIQVAADERKWQLDMTASTPLNSTGATGSGHTLLFDLNIPIDNVQGQADEVRARVALEQAKLGLKQKKDDLVRQVMTTWQAIRSDWLQINVATNAVRFQAQTLKAAQLRLKYGRSTVFEVTQVQDTLVQQRTALIAAKMTYLNDITALYHLWGETLKQWDVQLRE